MGELETAIVSYLSTNPKAAVVLTIIVVFRAVFKPIMTAIDVYVQSTPSKTDDEKWAAIKGSKAYKVFAWLVDYLLSIKLPQSSPPSA